MAAQSLTLSAWSARKLPDENIFDRTLRGDPVAFSEVYRRYQKRIYGYCLARSLDPDTAADATQEVFMKLLRAEPGSIDNPKAWLFTVARNTVIDVIRKRSRTPEDPAIEEESQAWDRLKSADTADEVLSRSDARNVFLALRTLRPRYRTALIMREVHGQTAKDMAEALETSPGAVDTLLSRARDAFGVAYASVGDLPSACRANIELIYRRLGTGVTDQEQAAIQAHLAGCERCRAEAKRANDPHHLAALLPFLVPAKRFAGGLLDRAALTVRTFPDVVTQQSAVVLTQPHSWNVMTKIAAGIATVAIVTAPIVATTVRHPVPATAERSASAGPTRSWPSSWNGGSSTWPSSHAAAGAAGMGIWSSGWSQQPMSSPGPTSPSMYGSSRTGWSDGMTSGSGSSAPMTTAPKATMPQSPTHSGTMSSSHSTSSGSSSSGSGSHSGSGSWSSHSGSWSSGGSSSMDSGTGGW